MPVSSSNPYRLPRSVVPERYDLTLEPDLDRAVFAGSEVIAVAVTEATDSVVLNAKEMEIDEAWLEPSSGARITSRGIALDAKTERATITLERKATPGLHKLHIRFRGILNDKLHGFYRSTFSDDKGVQHTIATTQFEPTDARKAFPCFDEPDLKAVFGVTLVVPGDLFAVSNAPVVSDERRGGRRTVRFADTMKMSTYLVAFVIGPFEATKPVDVDGIPLRIVHPIGKANLVPFAVEIGAFSMRFFAKYYGIPYPAQKLDLVAVPDFAAGAMENLGCITFRETALLVDRQRATQGELTRVADVVAHEMAHMWFGDLVTMRWWNGLWLNEAFATFMGTSCVAAFKPEWRRWAQFSLERSAAFDVDSLASTRPIEYPVVSPQDAEGMFDVLTYEKGASLLRMLEQYLGEEGFRDGIRRYLNEHRYGNTETTDLWDAIEKVTGQPVRRIMDSWIFQGGYPMISVTPKDGGKSLHVDQHLFRFNEPKSAASQKWSVPLVLRVGEHGKAAEKRDLLEGPATDVHLAKEPAYVVANAGGYGFYRVEYAPELLDRVVARIASLDPVERYGLIDDLWASVLSGRRSAAEFLRLVHGFRDESDVDVWRLISGCLGQIDRILDGAPRKHLAAQTRELFAPALERLGWEPKAGEAERTRELRSLVIGGMAVLGNDTATQSKARAVHARYVTHPGSVDPNVAAAAASAVAAAGSDGDYDTFVQRFKAAATPQEEMRYLHLLPEFPTAKQMERSLAMCLNGEIRTQDAPFQMAYAMMNHDHGVAAWRFVRDNWKVCNEKFPSNTIPRMLSGVRALSKPEVASEVLAFFKEHEVPQGRLMVEQHLEKLQVNVAFRQREASRLAEALKAGTKA
ncbi:MAG: M1 family metallopeptidase [Chloroflexi bacterium]|nr:M1 family metallopeptidase [Chloroflexota bacterium]